MKLCQYMQAYLLNVLKEANDFSPDGIIKRCINVHLCSSFLFLNTNKVESPGRNDKVEN